MAVQRKIFISYRQADNPDFVDRIRDRLTTKHGDENVFMDFITIPPGVPFVDYLRASMAKCDAVVAVIGPKWIELFQEKASKFQDDYVRVELALALELGKPILPICIAGAKVPAASDLPPELRPLLGYNMAFLERTTFNDRIPRVLHGLEEAIQLRQNASGQNKVSTGEMPAAAPAADDDDGWKPTLDKTEAAAPKSFIKSSLWSKMLEATQAPPLDAEGYYDRALDHEAAGERDAAIADYSEALRLNPNYADAYNNLGNLVLEQGDQPAALNAYNRAVELEPTSAMMRNNRGLARYKSDVWADYDGAIADFTEAIRLKPDYDQPYLNRGAAYAAKNDYEAAIADFTTLITLTPTMASAYYNRGLCRKELGDLDGALADYDQALAYAPDDATIYNNRGIANTIKGDTIGALADFSRSIMLGNPEPHLPYYNRASLYFNTGKYPAAIADYDEALRLYPAFAPAYLSRGWTAYQRGDVSAAIADYEHYLTLNPDDAAVQDALRQMREGTNSS